MNTALVFIPLVRMSVWMQVVSVLVIVIMRHVMACNGVIVIWYHLAYHIRGHKHYRDVYASTGLAFSLTHSIGNCVKNP